MAWISHRLHPRLALFALPWCKFQVASWRASRFPRPLRSWQLRRRRALVAIQMALEIASVSTAVFVAFWIRRHSPGVQIGSLLLGWLVLQAVLVSLLRSRERVSDTSSVMEGIAASIERVRRRRERREDIRRALGT